MAALESGVADAGKDYVNCKGAYWVALHQVLGVHGNVNYYSGMAGSCNVYFQEMGRRAGQESIVKIAREFGLGSKTGIDLPYETAGLLPTVEWKRELNALLTDRQYEARRAEIEQKYQDLLEKAPDDKTRQSLEAQKKQDVARLEAQYQIDYNFNTKWQPYDTFNMSIGEGYNEYTVLQLANYAATIANGGRLLQPYVVDRITAPDGRVIEQFSPRVVHQVEGFPADPGPGQTGYAGCFRAGRNRLLLFNHFPDHIKVAAKPERPEPPLCGRVFRQLQQGVPGLCSFRQS